MYTEKVMKHFRNPRNMGELENPDITVKVGNPACGDVMEIFMDVEENDGKRTVENIKFKTFGCGAAIATSSVATILVKGESIEKAEKLRFKDIAEELGGLPDIKIHCSQLASVGIHEALYQYRKEEGLEISEKLQKEHRKAVNSLKAAEEKKV